MQIANCNHFLIALGANLGGSAGKNAEAIRAAIGMIERAGIKATMTSDLWRTPAFPADSGPDFVNGCASIETALSPHELLGVLHDVEAGLGRVRGARWSARTIDIDLLAADAQMLPDRETLTFWMNLPPEKQRQLEPKELILPHPRLHERAFVLVPLAQIAPDWEHPLLKKTVRAMEKALDAEARAQIRPI